MFLHAVTLTNFRTMMFSARIVTKYLLVKYTSLSTKDKFDPMSNLIRYCSLDNLIHTFWPALSELREIITHEV